MVPGRPPRDVQDTKEKGSDNTGSGNVTLVTAGTVIQLPNIPCKRVFIQAFDTNTGVIVVGGIDVKALATDRKGVAYFPSQGNWHNVSNLNLLYIDSTVNGDKISYNFEN